MLKKLLLKIGIILAVIFVYSPDTWAIPITVNSYQVTNWQYGGSTAKLRIYSDTTFITSDGKTIIAGSPNVTGGFYKEVTITIASNIATIPSFSLDSTTDGQNTTSARYTAVFFDSNNRRLGAFAPFTQFFLSHVPGASQTWTSIGSYNFTGPAPPGLRFTFDDATIQRMLSGITGFTDPMSAVGDIIVGTTAGAATRLPIGSSGQYAKVSGGTVAYGSILNADVAELLAVTDLSTYTATSGTGTTALRTTITSPTTNQAIIWNGTNWVNGTAGGGAGTITSINADATAAQTFTVNTSQFPTLTITDNGTGDHKLGLSGAIGTTIGGTNLTSYTTGDLIYGSASNVLSKRAIGTTGYPLIVSGGVPNWGQLDLTVGVTGVLPVANGGSANAFFAVTGPAGTIKTFTLPNANAVILTDQAAVTTAQGGTNIQTYTTGDTLYASASNVLSKRSIGADNTVFRVSSGLPVWGALNLATDVTGVLAFANGGIGAAGLTPGYVKSTGSAYTAVAVPIPIADGGSNNTGSGYTSFGAFYYTGTAFGTSNAGTTGTILTGVTSSAPAFSATPTLTSLTLSGLTANSVVFAGTAGILSQNNSRFTWDNSNFRLSVQDTIRLLGSSSGFVGLKAAAAAGGTTYTLPSADGTVNQVLSTDGAGTLFFATVSGGGSGITSLNGLTTSTQTITIATTGATSPTIDQPTSSNNRIIIPLASASNSSGLVTNASQVISGAKTLDAVLALANGTTSNPPILFTCSSCAVTTSPQNGAFETNGQFLYYTQSLPSTARKTIAYTDTTITDGQLSANVQLKTEKGANDGYAPLNSSGFVDLADGGLGIGLTIGTAGTILRSDGSNVAFSTDGSALTALNATNISSGTLNNARLSGVELTANKAASGGYASLDGSTKVPIAQISEVLAIADTTTYNGVSGSGTTAIASTITAPADTQYLKYDSATNNWINANLPSSSVHNLLDGVVHPDTSATTVVRGMVVVGNATPKWAGLTLGAINKSLTSDGTDAVWAFVDINSGTTSNLVATRGGTGLTSGTSGGLLYFNSGTTIASSGALTANAILYGSGAGAAPGVITNNATATRKFVTQVSSGAPAYDILANGDVAELLAVTDLSTYSGTSGTGVTAIRSTFTSLTTNDVLTWSGTNWINQAPGGGSTHDILSATHTDSLAAAVVRGDVMVGNATPKWSRKAVDTSNRIFVNDGTDATWGKVDLTASTNVSGILTATNGGVNNAFFQISGPATTIKTYTITDTSTTIATILSKLDAFAATTSAELKTVISDESGSGALVFANTPTLVTPVLGAATATSINGLTLTSSTGVLTITNAKTLSVSNTLTFTGTDTSSVAFGAGGTVAYTGNNLSVFAATTSAQLAGVINDETGSGLAVFATTPTLTTPVLGVATATSINKVAITAPATSSTLTVADGSSLITSGANSLTLTTTGTTNATLPSGTKTLVATDVATLSSLASVGTITTGVWNATDIAVADGGTGLSSATAYALLAGGTTSTGAFQSIASVGTAGQVLMSNGAGALPTFQTAASGMSTLLAQVSNAEVTTSTAENTELTYSLAANTLSTNRGFHVQVQVLFTDGVGTRTLTPRLKFGGTTIHGQAVTTSGTQTFLITIDWYLYNSNATNLQYSAMDLRYTATALGTTATAPTVLYGQNTSAIDTTASKDIVVTMQMGTSNAAIKYKVVNANVRLLY